jgi:hypothetical protein
MPYAPNLEQDEREGEMEYLAPSHCFVNEAVSTKLSLQRCLHLIVVVGLVRLCDPESHSRHGSVYAFTLCLCCSVCR